MPAKEIEIPVAFPDRRQVVIKISPKANVLDLKRAIAKSDAVEVIAAGANADLLGKRYTAPATFRLICRGLELNNTGTLEYYHLTTKGKNQPAIKVTPKHESLIDDDEVLDEDFAVPETVAHLDEERKQKEQQEEEARLAAKKKLETFHQAAVGKGANNNNTNSPTNNNNNNHNTSKRSASRGRPAATGSRPGSKNEIHSNDVSSATATMMMRATNNDTPSVYDRNNIPTPDPMNPYIANNPYYANNHNNNSTNFLNNSQQQQNTASAIKQQQQDVLQQTTGSAPFPNYQQNPNNLSQMTTASSTTNSNWIGQRHHLPPLGDVTQFSHQQGLTFKEVVVPTSPSRGLKPIHHNNHNNTSSLQSNNNNAGTAYFAIPISDVTAPMMPMPGGKNNTSSSGGSPDIIRQMKSYLRAAEKGEVPLPQVMPLPGSARGDHNYVGLSPPRNLLVGRNLLGTNINISNNAMIDDGSSNLGCSNGEHCGYYQRLMAAEERIKQLEGTVDRYKTLLHRLTQIEQQDQQQQVTSAPPPQGQPQKRM